MAYTLDFQIMDSWLRVTCTGCIETRGEYRALCREIGRRGLDGNIPRALVDERGLEQRNLDICDIMQTVDVFASENWQAMGGRFACLLTPGQRALGRQKETVYRNRSFSYALFERERDAIAWLTR